MLGSEIFFNWPEAGLFFFLLAPILYLQFSLNRYRLRQQATYASPYLLPQLITPRSFWFKWTKAIGWGVIWVLGCLALMQPFGNIRYSPLALQSSAQLSTIPQEIIFLIDNSPSMRVSDGLNGETRLEEAKSIMEDVIRQLQGQTISLYTFSSQLKIVVPSTLDYVFTRLAIKDLQIDQEDTGGTRFAVVLKSLQEEAFPEPSVKHYTIIMLTDGGDTQLEALKGQARQKNMQEILTAISDPGKFHVHLLTIGLGSLKSHQIPNVTFDGKPVLSKLEPDVLKELAAQDRGVYYMAHQWSSWDLAKELIMHIEQNLKKEFQQVHQERQVVAIREEDKITDLYYQIPLGLAILFYFLNLLLPDVRRL